MQTIYDLLTNQKISELTVENLDTATARTYIEKGGTDFWQGILVLSHILNASRTYAHGLPIPETGLVEVVTVADSATESIKPTGTEVWIVENIDLDNCIAGFYDGKNPPPFHISASCWLAFSNGSGSEQTPSIAYFKVSL